MKRVRHVVAEESLRCAKKVLECHKSLNVAMKQERFDCALSHAADLHRCLVEYVSLQRVSSLQDEYSVEDGD